MTTYTDTSDFSLVVTSPAFVDKTMLIKFLFEQEEKCWIVHAPSGFGKSTNLDMIRRFLEIDIDDDGDILCLDKSFSYRTFIYNNLEISKQYLFCSEHLQHYAVICLSLKNITGATIQELRNQYAERLSRAFHRHIYLLQSNLPRSMKNQFVRFNNEELCKNLEEEQLQHGLPLLAKMLYDYHKTFSIVLIDDYDHPYVHFMTNTKIVGNIIVYNKFFADIVHEIIKSEYVRQCTIVGTVDCSFFIGYIPNNMIKVSTYLFHPDKIPWFGLSRMEIIKLLYKLKCYSKPFLQKIIRHYAISSFDNTLTSCTLSVIKSVCLRKLLNFREIPALGMIFKKALHLYRVRHIINRLVAHNTDNDNFRISVMKVNHLESVFTQPFVILCPPLFDCSYLFLWYFIYVGFFHINITSENVLQLSLAGYSYSELIQHLQNYYGQELDDHIVACGENLRKIGQDLPQDFYMIYFIQQLKLTIDLYLKKFNERGKNILIIYCIADIIARGGFDDQHFEIMNTECTETKDCYEYIGSIIYDNNEIRFIITICVLSDVGTSSAFYKANQRRNGVEINEPRNNIVIGININNNLQLEIQWLYGYDVNNIKYYQYPV